MLGVTSCSANFDDMGGRRLLVFDDAGLVYTNAMNSLKEFISSRTIPGIHLQHGRHKANKRNAIPSLITQLPDQTLLESRMLSLLEHDDIDLVSVLSLIHISEPTRLLSISYAVFCLKKKKKKKTKKKRRHYKKK
eukprot:TRINITY_DN4013_c0_g1_i9.p2 TRINITY_DN4013_c0_g1~~TRINITY_DN4013_c0_g1_i9.p2  ORF type:complete len:135 (-),score=21.99 TRINITY_DN4013_c0_g1_i9:51-455(-)